MNELANDIYSGFRNARRTASYASTTIDPELLSNYTSELALFRLYLVIEGIRESVVLERIDVPTQLRRYLRNARTTASVAPVWIA